MAAVVLCGRSLCHIPLGLAMYLGIEIGGTKLQFGVSAGDGSSFSDFVRCDVEPEKGATGILAQIEREGTRLIQANEVERVGFGFGGPVDPASGSVIKSHQIQGWDNFPLANWCEQHLQRPAVLCNDCDAAAVAEANFGAGRLPMDDKDRVVFYVTVGTGIGGGLVINGKLFGQHAKAASEIGHLRCGPLAELPEQTVESVAAGPAIASAAASIAASIAEANSDSPDDAGELMELCGGNLDSLTTHHLAVVARRSNRIASRVIEEAVQTLGWAISQVSTLVAPQVVVVGGGVSLMGEDLFFEPLRKAVAKYQFPPLVGSMKVLPPQLGEEVVVHGAAYLASLG